MKPAEQKQTTPDTRERTKRLLAWACALIFAVTTLPLYIISLYNHPYYDDFNFSKNTHAAWRDTGSLTEVIKTAVSSSQNVRETWQGTYTGTVLSNLQPGVFSENLYFLTTFLLLSAFLLCFGFFLKTLFGDILGFAKTECVISISLTLILLVQFMPDPGEAFFWFNGGIGNTFIYSLLALSLGLCVKLERAVGRVRPVMLITALAVLMVLLGGGSYGGGVFGLLVFALLTIRGFVQKSRWRFIYPALTILFLACFLYSIAAPGNAARAKILGSQVSPITAVLQALYYGIAVGGGYIQLPLVGITLCLLPFFVRAAKQSPFSFRHIWLVLAGGVCLFCTQFTPPLYSAAFIGGPRAEDTYFQSFVILWLSFAYYLTGYILRKQEKAQAAKQTQRLEQAQDPGQAPGLEQTQDPVQTHGLPLQGFLRKLVITGCCLILIGSLVYKRTPDATYGPHNLAGGSAALSLLSGEAQQYDREMKAREALLNDRSLPDITLAPISAVPDIFMDDLLTAYYYRSIRKVLCEYYGKQSITLGGE